MYKLALFFSFFFSAPYFSQHDSTSLKQGDKAPSFVLTLKDNVVRNFAFPYSKHIVLLHFWSNDYVSKSNNHQLKSIAERYKNTMYKSADGFEVISVAVKLDKKIWQEVVKADSLTLFTNGIATKDYSDEVCKKYTISSAPRNVLIDETGSVIALDPSMKELEAQLGERKVFQPIKKDLNGLLAKSLNRDEVIKSGKLSLYTIYGDSIGASTSSSNGKFSFNKVKLNQDLVLKIANQSEMDLSDPVALYSPTGDFLMNGSVIGDFCVFNISYKVAYRLLDVNAANTPNEQMNLVANLEFSNTGTFQLSPKDEEELNTITSILKKNKALTVEFKTHTDSKLSEIAAMDVTTRQVQLIKNYFLKKGLASSRIKGIPKGKTALSKPCEGAKCTEEDHRQNRRVEFLIS